MSQMNQPLDHAAAHERIADLALEPAALDAALASGPDGDRELAAHVATCERCQADVAAWRGVQGSLAGALGAAASRPGDRRDLEPIEPGRDLRASILAAAAADARQRAGAPALAGASTAAPTTTIATANATPVLRFPTFGRLTSSTGQVFLGLAAAFVVAVAGTLLLAGPTSDLLRTVDEARSLTGVVAATNRILADPAHRSVALTASDGSTGGSVVWSSQDLVVLTSALEAPAAGSVYRCWVVGKGHETPIGQMEFAGGTAYWVGSLDDWASIALRPGWSFYVTLESGTTGSARSGPVVLEADF